MGIRVATMTTSNMACLLFPIYRSSESNIFPADAYLIPGPGNYGDLDGDYLAKLFTRYMQPDEHPAQRQLNMS